MIVTNGPLIRPLANNRLPGHVFKASAGEELELEITLNLATREPISYLDIVKDGRVVQSVRLDEVAKTGHLPPVKFTESGWVLVRAVTDNDEDLPLCRDRSVVRRNRRISRGSARHRRSSFSIGRTSAPRS